MAGVIKIKNVDFVEHCTLCLVKLTTFKSKRTIKLSAPIVYQLWGFILEDLNNENVVYNFGRKDGDNRVYSEVPSLCSNCEENFSKLAQLQEDCLEINRKLNYQKEVIQAIAFNCGPNGANEERNDKFEKWLAGANVRAEVVDNTKEFNQQLRGNKRKCKSPVNDMNPVESATTATRDNKSNTRSSRSSLISSLKPAKIVLSRCETGETPIDDNTSPVLVDSIDPNPEIKSERVSSDEDDFDNGADDYLTPDWGPGPKVVKTYSEVDTAPPAPAVRKRGPKFLSTSNFPGRQRCQACDICNESIPVTQISAHLESHLGPNYVYTCPNPLCFQSYITPFRLERLHLRPSPKCKRFDSNKSKLETCDTCQIKTTYPKLKFHLEKAHETADKDLSCPFPNCDAKFTVHQSLQLHLHSHVYTNCQKTEITTPKTQAPSELPSTSEAPVEELGYQSETAFDTSIHSPPESAEEDLHSDASYHPSPPKKKRKIAKKGLKKSKPITQRFQTCDVCNDPIPVPQMSTHLRTHFGDYVYKCPNPRCFQAHISPFRLTRMHLNRSTKCVAFRTNTSKLETCATCRMEFSLANLKLHAAEHETSEKNFSCPVELCPEQFTMKQCLELHLHKHLYCPTEPSTGHKYTAVPRPIPTGVSNCTKMPRKSGPKSILSDCKRYLAQSCDICNETIPVSKLAAHLHTHVNTVYNCPNPSCDKAYVTSFLLERLHLQKNKICRSFNPRQSQLETCEVCHIKIRFSKLKFHLSKHETPDKNYFCPFPNCKYASTVKQSLEIHTHEHCYKVPATMQKCKMCLTLVPLPEMAAHLKNKHQISQLFYCDVCPFVYTSRYSKIWHMFNHHVEQGDGMECDICGENGGRFYTRTEAKQHYDSVHDKIKKSVTTSEVLKPTKLKPIKKKPKNTGGPKYSKEFSSRPERSQSCDICNENIPLTQISEHLRSHVGEHVYECPNPKCLYAFISPIRLDRYHLRSNSPKCMKFAPPRKSKTKYHDTCSVCNKQLTLHLLRRHLEECHETPVKNYSCPLSGCEEQFTVKQLLDMHLLKHVYTPPVTGQKCDVCNEEIELSEITSHLVNSHQIDNPLPCDQCSHVFSSKASHLNHVINIHISVNDEMICDICGDAGGKFYAKMNFRQHYFDAHGIGNVFKCELCSQDLLSYSALKHHRWVDHRDKYTKQKCDCADLDKCPHPIAILNRYKTFDCSFCDVKYKRKDFLIAHEIRDHEAERLQCEKCPESFGHPLDYKNHLKEHDGIFINQRNVKRHLCPHCDMAFRTPGYLKCHVLTKHTAESDTPYNICQYCGKRFVSKNHFTYHVKKWHESDKEPWKTCRFCNKKVNGGTNLRNHERTHTGERPFTCEHCGQAFRLRETLKRHLRGHAGKQDAFRPRGSRVKKEMQS